MDFPKAPFGLNSFGRAAFGSRTNSTIWDIYSFVAAYPALTDVQNVAKSGTTMNLMPKGQGTATSTHAAPILFPDADGVYRSADVDEPAWKGARVVENRCIKSSGLDTWGLINSSRTLGIADPDGGSNAVRLTGLTDSAAWIYGNNYYQLPAGGYAATTWWIRRVSGIGAVYLSVGANAQYTDVASVLTTDWQRISVSGQNTTEVLNGQIGIRVFDSGSIDIYSPQIEHSDAPVIPGEYVENPYTSLGAIAKQTFSTTNGNTVTNNIVTDALGDPLAEQPFAQCNKAATNYITNSNYFGSSNVATDSITPIGTFRARELTITPSSSTYQTVIVLDNTEVNIYLWVKAPSVGASIALRMATNNIVSWGTGISEKIILTNEWQLFKFSGQASTTTNVKLILGGIDTNNSPDPDCDGKVLICGVSLGDGLAYQPYIPTTSAAASIPKLEYTYDSLNIDPSDAAINITIDWQGDDTQILTMGDLSLSIGPIGDGIELYSNTGFDTDTIWSKGTGWTISGGEAHAVNSVWSQLKQGPPLTIGDGYIAQLDITANGPINSLALVVGGVGFNSNVVGHFVGSTRSAKDQNAYVRGHLNWTGSIDNFSLQRIVTGLILTDGISQRLEIPISVIGEHSIKVTLNDTASEMTLSLNEAPAISGSYSTVAAGPITVAETHREFTVA